MPEGAAPAPLAFGNRPFDHFPSEAAAAIVRRNAHAFDLAAPHADSRKPRDERYLETADDRAIALLSGDPIA
jgi:hypothetical protein